MENRHRVLVVCEHLATSNQLRMGLRTLGVEHVFTPANMKAVSHLGSSKFTHVFFDLGRPDPETLSFARKILEIDSEVTLIGVAAEPRIEHIFRLLQVGARGCLVVPFSNESLEQVFNHATANVRISEAVFQSKNRNVPLAEGIVNSLDRLASAMSNVRHTAATAGALPQLLAELRETTKTAFAHCERSPEHLREAIVDTCLNRASGKPRRLRKIREYLQEHRRRTVEGAKRRGNSR